MLTLLYDLLLCLFAALPWCVPMFFFSACSCCGCDLAREDYSSDTSSNYTTVSGSWTVTTSGDTYEGFGTTGYMHTASNGALRVHTTESSGGVGRLWTAVYGDTAGLVARVIGAYTDSDNYLFAEITFGAGTNDCKFYERVGGVNTQLGSTYVYSAALSTWFDVVVCWDGVHASMKVGTASESGANFNGMRVYESCTLTGTKAAVGADASGGQVRFGFFRFLRTKIENSTCVSCQPCETICSESTQGTQKQVVITATSGGPYAGEGTYLLDFCDSAPGCRYFLTGLAAGGCGNNLIYSMASGLNAMTLYFKADPACGIGGPSGGWVNTASVTFDCSTYTFASSDRLILGCTVNPMSAVVTAL